MGETPVKRSMDEFLINPIVPMDDYSSYRQSRTSNRNSLLVDSPNVLFSAHRSGKQRFDRPAAIRTFENDAVYLRGYTSDEEVASPVENGEFAFDSTSSDGDGESIASVHEAQYHAQSCSNAQQLCNRAQAVQLVSAGKPKVVSMPKLVDASLAYSPSPTASDYETETRPTVSSMSYMQPAGTHPYVNSNTSSSPRSSGENSLYPSTPILRSAPVMTNSVRRKPNLLPLQTTPRSDSHQSSNSGRTPQTAWPIGRPNFLDYDPFPSDRPVHGVSSASAPKRKLHRLSPTFSLKNLSRSLGRGSISDGNPGDSGINKKDIIYPVVSPVPSHIQKPTRTPSRTWPKMVARAANERAAAIEIPPCPDKYQDDFNVPVWPQRGDSVANMIYPRPGASRAHGRRKSLGAFVWSQM